MWFGLLIIADKRVVKDFGKLHDAIAYNQSNTSSLFSTGT